MKNYKAYLFDFDYTLANSEKGILKCFHHVFEQEGFTGIADSDVVRTIGMPIPEEFRILTGITDTERLEALRKQFVAMSEKIMVANTVLFPQTANTLTTLKNDGASVGIISTKYRKRIQGTIEKFNMNYVDFVIGGEDVKAMKPDPEGVELAAKRLKLAKHELLYIGDSLVDAKTARNAGVDFAAVTTGATLANEFNDYPYVGIFENLTGLLR